jgi:UDP-perosamine 4-acetyltransferase
VRVVVFGSRPDGHARVIIEILDELGGFVVMGLIDDYPENGSRCIGAHAVVGGRADLERLAGSGVDGLVLGFGAARHRNATLDIARAAGLALPPVVHATASLARSASFAEGVQILQRCVVASGVRLGAGVLLGSGAIVEHDGVVSDGAVLGPGVVLAGRVSIGPEAELGAGAIVLPDRKIGAGARVGAGAVVTRDVSAGALAVGVPARERAAPPPVYQ